MTFVEVSCDQRLTFWYCDKCHILILSSANNNKYNNDKIGHSLLVSHIIGSKFESLYEHTHIS